MNQITEITKRDIYELFRDGYTEPDDIFSFKIVYPYYGRLEEIEFLSRLYDLEKIREKEGNMNFPRSAHVITHILADLKCAHENGVIHRDLRTGNVVFSTEERLFKIIDFGVSAFLDTENHTKLTKTGEHIAGECS